MSRSVAAVIVAAGSGSRMGGGVPKQFLEVGGRPLLVHALLPFETHPRVSAITVLVPDGYAEEWDEKLTNRYGLHKITAVVEGGPNRRDSARIGVMLAAGASPAEVLVAIHDGARPNPSLNLMDRLFAAADEHGAAVPVLPVSDTVVNSPDAMWWESTVDRSGLGFVQTPQVFRGDWIADAHRQAGDPAVTDDAQIVHAMGHPVRLVEGEAGNLKVTTPGDLELLRAIVAAGEA